MSKDHKLHPTLAGALHLDGSPEAIREFYADWAERYDKDNDGWNYAAPVQALRLLTSLEPSQWITVDPRDPELHILDAGCGTGLLARRLAAGGYVNLDGFDISPEMVALAGDSGLYRALRDDVDINAPAPEDWRKRYDCVIATGVFTPGHVSPDALARLVEMTRRGGLVIVSTRVAYYQSENFAAVSERMRQQDRIRQVGALQDAPYTADERAHYWAWAVTE